MSLRFRCDECGATTTLPDNRADRKNYCPRCDARLPDRPLRRGGGGSTALIVGLVLGVILLVGGGLVGLGLLFWFLAGAAQPQPIANNNAAQPKFAPAPQAMNPVPPPDPGPGIGLPNGDPPIAPAPMFPEVPGLAEVKKPKPTKPLNLPATPVRPKITPPVLAEKKDYKLPDTIARAIPAGGGRYLLLHIPSQRKVGVFDVNTAKIERFIDIAEDKPLLAAGMNKMLVYLPAAKILQRYDIEKGEREASKVINVPNVKALATGSASAGPLVVAASEGGRLFDVESLAEIDLPQDEAPPDPFGGPPGIMPGPKRLPFQSEKVWASANGKMFVGQGGFDGSAVLFEGNQLKIIRAHGESWMYSQPSADAKYVFRGGLGALTTDGQKTNDVVHSVPGGNAFVGYFFLPAADGPFYFHIHFANGARGYEARFQKDPERGVTVYMYGLDSPIARVIDLKDMPDFRALVNDGLPTNEMLHLIPRAKMLVTVNPARDKLTITPLDLDQAMDEAGIDFLLVTSSPPGTFCPGHEFKYPIRVRSKAGRPKYTLESGPKGMEVAANGTVTWKVPADFADKDLSVIVGIKDAGAKEAFHNFRLLKADKPEDFVAEPEPEPVKVPPMPDPKADGPRSKYRLPAIPPAIEIEAPEIASRTEVPIAKKYDSVVAGGGGRFLVLHAKSAQKAIVFEVSTAKVTRTIDVGDAKAIIAAGMSQLLVYRSTKNEIEKLNLITGASEGKKEIGMRGVIDMVMGSASAGPLFVRAGERAELFDVESLTPMSLPAADPFPFRRGNVWASANGRVFGNTVTKATGSFVQLAILKDDIILDRSELVAAPYVAPAADGNFVYIGGFGEHSLELKESNGYGRSFATGSDPAYQFVPSHSPEYLLMLHLGIGSARYFPAQKETTKGITIWHRDSRRPVAVLDDMPETPSELSGSATLPMLVHYVPDARVLVAASPSRDRLTIYPVALSGVATPVKRPIAWRLPNPTSTATFKSDAARVKSTIDIPGRILKIATGGAGRFLIYQVDHRKLVVFDVSTAKFVHEITTDDQIASFAAGTDKLVIMLQTSLGNKLQRIDIATGKIESVAGCTNDRTSLQMGSASNGPIYAVGANGINAFDLATLSPMRVPDNALDNLILDRDRVAISADGRTLASAPRVDAGGTRPIVLQFSKDGVKVATGEKGAVSSVSISPDGKYIFLGGNGIYGPDLKTAPGVVWSPETVSVQASTGLFFAPAAEGPYYLHLHLGVRGKGDRFAGDPQYGISVYKYGQDKPMGRLPNIIGETRISNEWERIAKPHGAYHFLASSKLLVAVDPSLNKLHIIPLDAENIPPSIEPEPIKPKPKSPPDPTPPKKTTPDPMPPKKTPKSPKVDPADVSGKPFRPIALPEPLPINEQKEAKTFTFSEKPMLSPARVHIGGGGRFVLVQRHPTKIDVFDVNEGKVIHKIEFTGHTTHWVVGMSKLVVVDPDQRTMRRYDLLTGKEDLSKQFTRYISVAAIGPASNGPLLGRESTRLRFVDLETLEPMDLFANELVIADYLNKTIWASPNGRTFGVGLGEVRLTGPPTGGRASTISLRLTATGVERSTGDFPSAYAVPDSTGRYMFAAAHGIYDAELRKVKGVARSEDPSPREPPKHVYLPAVDGPFYLHYHVANVPGFPGGGPGPAFPPPPPKPGAAAKDGDQADLSVYVYGQTKPIAEIKIPDPLAGEPFSPMAFARLPEHIQMIPSAKAIIVVAARAEKIHLIPFDPATAMSKSGVDAPWVTSIPPRTFKAGESLSYTVKVNGKPDGLKYSLDDATPSMTIAGDGTLTWKVPADAPAEAKVTIRVRSAKGESVHAFVMTRN